MPRKKNVPCRGGCGELLWTGNEKCWPCRMRDRPVPAPRRRPPYAPKPRTCARCGAEFLKSRVGRGSTTFCSTDCANASVSVRPRVMRQPQPKSNCAEPDCAKIAEKRGYCGSHYQKRCRPDRSHGPDDRFRRWAKAKDPGEEKRRLREKNDRRRVQKLGGEHETVDRQRVFERDGYRCFCGKSLDMTKVAPHHPLAPTIDHIVPLSKGGDHNYANVRAAHFECNLKRGNRGGNEQLALI